MPAKEFQSKKEDKEDTGPLKDRGCTDIICLLVFIVFFAGMAVLAYFAFQYGDPWRIINGYDSFGNTCGSNNTAVEGLDASLNGRDLTDYPYLFYFDFTVMLPTSLVSLGVFDGTGGSIETTMMICVKECPSDLFMAYTSTPISDYPSYTGTTRMKHYYDQYVNGSNFCQYDLFEDEDLVELFQNNNYSSVQDNKYVTKTGSSGPCPDYVLPADPVLNRCIPLFDTITDLATDLASDESSTLIDITDSVTDGINSMFGSNVSASEIMTYAMSDLMNSYQELAIMCASSLVISFIIILLLGWIAQIIIYAIAIATAIACLAGPAYFWYVWYEAYQEYQDSTIKLESTSENVDTLMYYAIIISVICLVVLLLIIFLRSRIGLMVTLFKEAGFMVMRMIVILFTPIVLALFIMAWAAIWSFVSAYVYTSGTATELLFTREYNLDVPESMANITMVYFKDHDYINYVWLYHLFGLYWGTEFFLACHEMAIAGAFVQFYWTRDKRKVHFPVVRGIWWVFRYHLGTVAFGSCIIAIIQLIRTILAYIQNKTKDSQSEVVKYLLMCLQCCLWCFEKVMKFINRNAYIYTAFKGSNFCSSCKKVFGLLLSNVVRVGVINCVGAFILFIGKFLVCLITGVLGYFMLKDNSELYYWAIPVLLASIFAFAVAHTFFSVYEIGIDTIFICFAEDETINDGTPGREYYMSKNLMEWVDNSGEALKNLKRKKKQQKAQAKAGKSGGDVEMTEK